ncbi:GGDEF domain-containing protein [Marinobacter caseinilyticus]|uniref:GGDEF domain-containing protein n=1 Tax=Marinobacter caseinilyticus TaxID=2692195 RepID=UPI00140E07AE|nr:GGDEF domain-containing protein [Marinobacter caseinilyticus]
MKASNPTLVVLGYRRQIVYHLHFWALVAAAPLILVQWSLDHKLLAALLALFCVNAVAVMACLRWRQKYLFEGRFFAILAALCAVYSTAINGYPGLYWSYPVIASIFFLLSLREACISNILFIGAMAMVSFGQFPEPDFWRIVFSLALTCIFVLVFAWLVGRLQTELTRLATTDPLTGCLNRSQLADILNSQIQLRERYERVSSLILIDLDHFKAVNDRWGHVAGDNVLQEAANRLRRRLRDSDQLFRIGGEEFMLVLPETRQKDAETLAHQLLTTISAGPFLEDIQLTASAGVTEVIKGETWSTWLNRADQALYSAKSKGRNRTVTLRGSMDSDAPGPENATNLS